MDNVQRLTEEECANVSITELGKLKILHYRPLKPDAPWYHIQVNIDAR